MKHYTSAAFAAFLALGACGDGNPFTVENEDDTSADPVTQEPPAQQPPAQQDPADATAPVPEVVSDSLSEFSFDPVAETLTISGLLRDGNVEDQVFNRNNALDQGDFQAYTFQDDPLDEHTTVFVRRLNTVEAAVGVTGGQFGFFSGGATYRRDGEFDPIVPSQPDDTGLVTYAGKYVGLSDVNGPATDLLPLPAGVDPSLAPAQAAPVTGDVFINVGFADNNVVGQVYNRQVETSGGTFAVPDLILVPTNLAADGSFSGTLEAQLDPAEDRTAIDGAYGGVIGGVDADSLAGGLYARDHFSTETGDPLESVEDEEEYGIFVIGRCGSTAQATDTTTADACAGVNSE